MKVTINIPSNKQDFKELWKKIKHPQRTKHNIGILDKIAKEICKEIKSGYWDKDISSYMREEVTKRILTIVYEHRNELK